MNKFIKHTGIVVPLDIANIDTDAIIPKQFLQKITRTDFGKYLFNNWRFLDDDGKDINPDFILNQSRYHNASILLTRENFGCGSSREHAIWALIDYGFHVVIAPSFSDIFYNNSLNNQLLSIKLPSIQIDELFKLVSMHERVILTVDLENQQIISNNSVYMFHIDNFHRYCLMNHLDNIDLTLMHDKDIKQYESNQLSFLR